MSIEEYNPKFPKDADGPSFRRQQYMQRAFNRRLHPSEVSDLADKAKVAPFYSPSGTGYSASESAKGNLNVEAWKDNIFSFWDLEAGDEVELLLSERVSMEPETYLVNVQLVDETSKGNEWDFIERNPSLPSDYFDNGGVLMTETPSSFQEGEYNFWVLDKNSDREFEDAREKLEYHFDFPETVDVTIAKQYLEMDYDRFSEGGFF